MFKIVILMKKRAGMSREDFIAHYENNHAALGRKHLGHLFRKYVRNYPAGAMDIDAGNGSSGSYDCITEIWLDDEAAFGEMQEIIARPEVSAELRADEVLFQDKSQSRFLIVEEVSG